MNNAFSQRHPVAGSRRAGRGFTLIELMVVMGIISLLVAIALPAFSAARRNAKKVTSEALVNVLGTGLEQFNADTTVGGNYPPSTYVLARNPHSTETTYRPFYGANLLVWALAGADLLGTPGFRDLDNSGNDGFGGWKSDTTKAWLTANVNPYLYTMGNDGRPAVARSGPYVDMSKIRLAKQDNTNATTPRFRIPTAQSVDAFSQVFLDGFDQPILYYKANQGAPGMVGSGAQYVPFTGGFQSGDDNNYALDNVNQYSPTGIYNILDNALYTGNSSNQGVNFGAGSNHPMGYLGTPTVNGNVTTWDKRGSFGQHVWNATITATLRPQRDDSYILISPGPDGLFGSADDVSNFPLNK